MPTWPPRSSTSRTDGRRTSRSRSARSSRLCDGRTDARGKRRLTSGTARTARSVRCSSCSRATGRSSSCSTTCTGPTARRSSCSARCCAGRLMLPCCSRSRSGRGQAPDRLRAALAVPGVERIVLDELSEREATALLGDLDPQSISEIYRHGGGNPFYLEQLARAAGDGRSTTVLGNGDGGLAVPGVPGGRRGIVRRGARIARAARAHAARGGRRGGGAVRARSRGGDRRARGVGGARRARRAPRARPRAHDAGAAPVRLPPSAPATRRLRGDPAGWRLGAHARAAAVLAGRDASPLQRAHHVEQSASQGDEAAIAVLLAAGSEAAARAPAAAARWFEAALRLLPASDDPRRVDVRVSLASACGPSASSTGAARCCSRRSIYCRRRPPIAASS